METIDFAREHKDLYTATNRIKEVIAERGVFLAVDGHGEPGGEDFRQAIEQLYSVIYTLKFSLKKAGIMDFKISKLECLWTVGDPQTTRPSQWEWRAMIRIPSQVTKAQCKAAIGMLKERKGLDASAVKRISWREGRALQVIHIGPYDKVEDTYRKLGSHAAEHGYKIKGPGHEIYINDPSRTAPEKLKTIVRLPIAHPRPDYARGQTDK